MLDQFWFVFYILLPTHLKLPVQMIFIINSPNICMNATQTYQPKQKDNLISVRQQADAKLPTNGIPFSDQFNNFKPIRNNCAFRSN